MQAILKDRKEPTLGYEPDTHIDDTIPAKATAVAFDKIPTSPIVPSITPPMTPAWDVTPAGVLGPPWPPPPTASEPMTQPTARDLYGLQAAQKQAEELLRLGPPAPKSAGTRFGLAESLHYAIEHSRDYQTQLETLYLSALDVTLQRHLFSPRPFVSQTFSVDGGQGDVDYRSALTATTTAGIRQQLPYGGEVVAQTLVTFVNGLNGSVSDGESAAVALSATIPLLRGAGMVNLEPLIQSERSLIYQVRAFEEYRRQFLVDIASRYFDLVTAQQNLANQRTNYLTLLELTRQTQALYVAGQINFLEVQRSFQSQLSAESSLVDAQQTYQSQLDRFKIVLGMPIAAAMDIEPVELALHIPEDEPDDAVAMALKYRLDLQTARDQIEDSRRQVQVAENQLLPDLDFFASGQVANSPGTAASRIDPHNAMTYRAGVTLDLPVDRLSERNDYRKSLINFHRSQRGYEQLKEQIAVDARDALRRIQQAQVKLKIQRLGIELAQRRLDYSTELLRQGQADARDVVESQNSLISASEAFERARAQLQTSLLQYLQETGTLRTDPAAGMLGQALQRNAR